MGLHVHSSEIPMAGLRVHSSESLMASQGTEASTSVNPALRHGHYFAFKFHDREGHAHRMDCGTENLDELLSAVIERIGTVDNQKHPKFSYVDDEGGDKALLVNDSDLAGAVSQARQAGLKVLRLHLDYPESSEQTLQKTDGFPFQSGLIAGSAALTSMGLLAFLNGSSR